MKRLISRLRKQNKFPSYITGSELSVSATTLLRQEQQKFFEDEIKTLQTSQVNSTSKILDLNPLLYNGVLCVGR